MQKQSHNRNIKKTFKDTNTIFFSINEIDKLNLLSLI